MGAGLTFTSHLHTLCECKWDPYYNKYISNFVINILSLLPPLPYEMGTQWFRGQLGLNLQRRRIRHSAEQGSHGGEGGRWGRWGGPGKDRLTPGRITKKDEGQMPGEV